MVRFLLCFLFFLSIFQVQAQNGRFPFGQVNFNDLQLKSYAKDTSANAVVLQEFGETYVDNSNDHNIIHEYHVKIKIFNSKAFEQANIVIPIYKNAGKGEKVSKIEAVTYNLVNSAVQQSKFDSKTFTENKTKYLDLVKFTLPNIKEGCIIEYSYTLESPYFRNFRNWEFQSDIPKMYSEYWVKIPGNYQYNITLKGFYKLDKNESELLKECFTPGGGYKADCSFNRYAMRDVPAFEEEEYMTARSNFLASINFELSEIQLFTGGKDKISKEWKDVDHEMRSDQKFGIQLKKGKDIFKDNLSALIATETDSLKKAQVIYNYLKNWYTWNDTYGITSELGIKKAFDGKTGNVADINLTLVAALNYAGFAADPIILSTRSNGNVIELYPVISDFNYVIAKVKINNTDYLLDGTDPFLPFGMVPMRCLNGKGRVIPAKGPSYWLDLKPKEKIKQISMLNLTLQKEGNFKGNVNFLSSGYDGLSERKEISTYNNHDDYIEAVDGKWSKIKIKKFEIKNLQELDQPLSQTYDVEIEGFDNLNKNKLLLNPFFLEGWEKNPFTSKARLYPVDLGAPIESQLILNLEYPAEFELASVPQSIALALPNNGGKFIFNVQNTGQRIILTSQIILSKPIYSSQEYHALKELFNRVVQSYKTNLVFNRKA